MIASSERKASPQISNAGQSKPVKKEKSLGEHNTESDNSKKKGAPNFSLSGLLNDNPNFNFNTQGQAKIQPKPGISEPAFGDGNSMDKTAKMNESEMPMQEISKVQAMHGVGKNILSLQSQARQQNDKVDKNGNSDEAVHFYAPFGDRIAKWGYGGPVEYTNVEGKTVTEYVGPWERHAFDAAIFAVGTGVVTEVVLKRLKLAEMIAKAIGMGVAFKIGYEGLDLKERIRCKTIDTYRWYGRYRYNYWDGKVLAVEYWGKEPTVKSMISPVYFEQAIVDADGNILFVNTDELSYYGIDLNAKRDTLPLFSYGKVDE